MIGVDYDRVMEGSPYDLEPFEIAHRMWYREQNELAYLHGAYVMDAIGSCFSKTHKYPTEPYNLDDGLDVAIDSESREEKAVMEMQQYIASLNMEGEKRQTT